MFKRMLCVLALALSMAAQTVSQPTPDDPDARPMVTKQDIVILQRAQKILHSAKQWNRADDRKCPEGAKSFSLYCALEQATLEVTGSFAHRGAAMQETRFVVEEFSAGRDYHHRLMDYNNDPKTTFADVQKVFRTAERRIRKRLQQEQNAR
jgi:hypothetical protein